MITVGSYRIGQQEWKYGSDGWYVMMWGWWPGNNGIPTWRWIKIEYDRVPAELKRRYSNDNKS